ncbi:MAG: helicase C-terminal domain-containing protein, partial [Leptotrichiaceae bacterium]
IEHIRENKGNPFNEFQVPQAVIKFKQGIGRLIRSKSDTGIITILDNRVITKYYGRKFLNSLPKTNIIVDSKENIIEII